MELARRIFSFSDPKTLIGLLDAAVVKDSTNVFKENESARIRREFHELMDWLSEKGFLTVGTDGALRVNTNKTDKKWLTGLWLESYCRATLARVLPAGTLIGFNVVKSVDERIGNEIDAMFLYGNCLHIVEVKAKGLLAGDVYKLGTIKENLGGLTARTCLLSSHPAFDALKARANKEGIQVIDSEFVWDETLLAERFRQWIGI